MSELRVFAFVRAKPGHEEAVKDGLIALVEPTRREAGCLTYDLHLRRDDPRSFMFFERWESPEALEAHRTAPHMKEVYARIGELLEGPAEVVVGDLLA